MKKSTLGISTHPIVVPFHCIRNISSPEDQAENRFVYTGQLPLSSLVSLPTNENVREYLVDAEGKQRRSPTQVHLAIRETLKERPSVFSVLNGGVVIVAKSSDIDEKARTLTLGRASIINGSQTQGEVKEFISNGGDGENTHVKFELIITNDDDLVADISIARNFQNDVKLLSIAGRKGELDELEAAMKQVNADIRLQKSESQRPTDENDLLHTEKLLQVIAALMPPELWWKNSDYSKTYTYSAKATCLKDFRYVHDEAKQGEEKFVEVYKYYLDIAPIAWKLYLKWKEHQGFQGTRLRSIDRNGREIVEVPDGIIFPILSALAQFTTKQNGSWMIKKPSVLDDKELIETAKRAYMEIANSKPEIMGKSRPCYSALEQITSIYKRLLGN
jgi:hypothetical protein